MQKEGSRYRGSFRFFMRAYAAYKPSIKLLYFDLLPLVFNRGPFEGTAAFCRPCAKMGVFLPVLRTLFNVRLYAAFMPAYAAYRRP